MIPSHTPPPAETVPASPHRLEVAALEFCRGVATQMGWEVKVDPMRRKALRAQAVSMLSVCTKALPSDNRALPLLEATLGALESAVGEEGIGEKRYGRAAKVLALRWRNLQKIWGAGNPRQLPELENLALLYELGGLRASSWRDEALRIRVRNFRTPDPVLEKDLAAAVEDHYGPWLTVVELEPMLEFCHDLACIWGGYLEDRALTQSVLKFGLKPDADRVWKLAAIKSSESQRVDLARLLDRLDLDLLMHDGSQLEAGVDSVLGLAGTLMRTSLKTPVRDLLNRLDTRISGERSISRKPLRRRIAKILEDWNVWAGLLQEELAESKSIKETLGLLGEAEAFLREHPHGDLLEVGTQKLKILAQAKLNDDSNLPQRLEAWAELQSITGHSDEADGLISMRLALEDSKDTDLSARCELLARLNRWNDLRRLLGMTEERESERVLGWRFRVASGLGEEVEVQRCFEAWLVRVTGPDAPEEPLVVPGLSRVLPVIQPKPETLNPLVARYGARLLPGQEALLVREPWRILVALDPEAPASLLPVKEEEALRWRWRQLPSGELRIQALESLIKDAESRLGPFHVLVAELLVDLGDTQKEEGLESLERAQRILESSPGHEGLLVRVFVAMAGICAQADGKGLERNLMKAIEILERMPPLSGDADDWVREMPSLLLIHLWRAQRLDDLVALGPRVQALMQRVSKPSRVADDLGPAIASIARVARLQSQLRAAGLP